MGADWYPHWFGLGLVNPRLVVGISVLLPLFLLVSCFAGATRAEPACPHPRAAIHPPDIQWWGPGKFSCSVCGLKAVNFNLLILNQSFWTHEVTAMRLPQLLLTNETTSMRLPELASIRLLLRQMVVSN
jgi:hypothetical protein